jgi:branched-chain amino acid transport system ATP-binding protein
MRAPAERDQGDSVLRCRDIELAFGGLRALKGVSLAIPKGQIFGLVGPNGSGKTSMVNVITGFYRPQSGSVSLFGQEVVGLKPHKIAARGVARTFQNLALFRGMTVLENILLGRHVFMGASALASLFYWVWALRNEVEHRRAVEELIDFMQIQDIRDEPVEVIPLGMQKRVELARALAAEPELLILDEPMAGMNQEEKRIYRALHSRRARRAQRHDFVDRASHGCGHRAMRSRRGPELRRKDRRRRAGTDHRRSKGRIRLSRSACGCASR